MNTTSTKYDPIDAQGVYLTLAVFKGERHKYMIVFPFLQQSLQNKYSFHLVKT